MNDWDPNVRFFPVTVCGLPPDISNTDLKVCLGQYGFKKIIFIKRFVGTHRVKNGNRVFHFSLLKQKLPEKILIGNRVLLESIFSSWEVSLDRFHSAGITIVFRQGDDFNICNVISNPSGRYYFNFCWMVTRRFYQLCLH